jgi:SprT-like family
MLGEMGRGGRNRGGRKQRPAGYYRVAGVDLRTEMDRLASLPVFGGADGPLRRHPPTLNIRRASSRPRTQLGFAIPDEWRISVTAFPGQRRGDAEETLLHELVHLFVGAARGTRRWHGREFKATLRRAMREGYGIMGVSVNGSYHGAYADALERRRSQAPTQRSKKVHPGQLALLESAISAP